MAVINVYKQYFAAKGSFGGTERRGALVMLISDSHDGSITYTAAVSFFPHKDDEDFSVSYDAYFEKQLYSAKGRRSKKREAALMKELGREIDALAEAVGASVLWDEPLRGAEMG